MGKSWKNPIKAENAARKGAIFTKLAREIQVAAKLGGPDPEYNPRLRMALEAARKQSVPQDTIERAIKKGAGLIEGLEIEEVTYEGFGPHKVGIIVECQTDNRTRTVAEVRSLFKKYNGSLGETGSVSWMFERIGLIEGTKEGSFDLEEEAIEAGANDVSKASDGTCSFITSPDSLDSVRQILSNRGWHLTKSELSYRPKTISDLNDQQKQEVYEFLNVLDEHDDTHRIHATLSY
ncbi:MAG: YebC/PmpR family DNA-binding transcriptional regulator [Bdellovibrionaceae bacterium]|nr:YebC/PmpR family DNA-binding transcriptional regulator [Pseudobdellovibrionaceae bacterium]MDW8190767.1 YebC/PmpR family DNA-binding transcriptional regulator [Pseudobdellovibrionaceae bacterium]